jgi:hypothetical protein
MPISPTMDRKSLPKCKKRECTLPSPPPPAPTRLSTPPPRPCTPPRNNHLHLSPHRTPLSHRGLHMSPSPSLAHYKSHLDPPPFASFLNREHGEDGQSTSLITENTHTPSRRLTTIGGSTVFPIGTPKRLVFPSLSESPFRTPGSRPHMIYDPHDPGALLDEELSRLGERDSPAGRGLYESPNVGSPGKWARWW